MKRVHAILAGPLLAAAILATPVMAQSEPSYPQELRSVPARVFSQPELDQMLAPVALYPDALLSQLLMAATYPLEIVQAARWSRANPHLEGEEAVRAVQNRDWDPSVKSMVAFPHLLARLDERIEWTGRLGEAFLAQEQHVMDTVQELRRRAYEAGNLRSSEELVVRRESDYILLDPPAQDRVYVPYYDTRVVYGRWWWPDYDPIVWSPWAGYYYTPGYTAFGWGVGVPLGHRFFYGTFDWPRRHVRHSHHRPWYHHSHRWHHGERWRHDHARSGWRHHGHAHSGSHRDRHPAWRGEGERPRHHDGHRDRHEGDRWRDGRRAGDARAAPAPAVRSVPVMPAPAHGYAAPAHGYAVPARAAGTPLPPRSPAAIPSAAPAPTAVPFGRSTSAPPQMAPRSLPMERSVHVPRSLPAPAAVERPPAPPPAERASAPARESHAPARGRER